MILLCGSRSFPPVPGSFYTITIDHTPDDSPRLATKLNILVEDYGVDLFYHVNEYSRFENMWPILSSLECSLFNGGSMGYLIPDPHCRDDMLRTFTESYRCFFIALGKATDINPIILLQEFRSEAINYIQRNPSSVHNGSTKASPLLSLFLHSSYVEEAVLE